MNLDKIKKIIFFLFGIYTIMPRYFEMFTIGSQIVVAIIIVVVYLLFFFKGKILSLPVKYSFAFFIPYAITLLVHRQYFSIMRFFCEMVILLIILSQVIETKDDLKNVLDIIILFCMIEVFFGIIHFFTDFNIFSLISNTTDPNFLKSDFGPGTQYRMGLVRIEGSFSQAITFGIYLSICAIICLYLYNISNSKKYIVFYSFIVVALVLTLSRMPILVFIISQIFYVFSHDFKKSMGILVRLAVIGIILFILIFTIFPNAYKSIINFFDYMYNSVFSKEALSGISSYNEKSAYTYRRTMLEEIPSQLPGFNLFGIGPEGMENFKFYVNNSVQRSIDNQYLYYYVVYGICGLIFTVLWFGQLLLIDRDRTNDGKKLKEYRFYRNIIIGLYAINLCSVAMMEEYKCLTVIIGLSLAEIKLRREKVEKTFDIQVNKKTV